MNILVTGCAGFIGWKVTELLLKKDHCVIGIDNVNHSYDVRLKEWRLGRLKADANFRFHKMDVADRSVVSSLSSLVESFEPLDAVVNLAAKAGVRPSLDDPWSYYETNVIGTLNLLELCRDRGIPKFILSSTSSVYGETERPFREDQPADQPASPYAATKKAAESLSYTYHRLYGLDVTVLRYFTVYGPAGRPDMSPFRFIKWIAEEQPLILYGDGLQERDFTFVDDIAAGTVAGLEPLGFQIINLGSDRPVTLRTLISLIENLLQKKAQIDNQPPQPGDVKATWADISKARELLDWKPLIPLEEGLSQAVEWYMAERDWAREVAL